MPLPESLSLKKRMINFVEELQEEVCRKLEGFESHARFKRINWARKEGGGGVTRPLEDGEVFEKAAVNVSTVFGDLPQALAQKLKVSAEPFFATGISSIIHPQNPFVPTIHFNFRYFELASGDAWFGGGLDLTPYYPFREDVVSFHQVLKDICDKHNPEYYPRFKKWCDEYFYLPHRGETRGVGGLFFDYLREDLDSQFDFVRNLSRALFDGYLPIVEKRSNLTFGAREREWQEIRRGRYVEFNLLYDRGTKFGLESGGQIESILLSLPPHVQWRYDYQPEVGSREAELLKYLKPTSWLDQER